MHAFLASLIFVAAGEVAPPPPPPVPDAEVVRYLKSNELAEWNGAMRATLAGETRVKQGTSIMTLVRPVTLDKSSETPEQSKERGQKIVDEGNAQIQKALPSLTRLRSLAAVRAAEFTKPVAYEADFAQRSWSAAVTQSVLRLQKQSRDLGYAQTHLIGGFALLGDGKLSRPPVLAESLRAAWLKADERSLAPLPAEGYAYLPVAGQVAPALAKSLKPASAPGQASILWAEFYAVSQEGSMGLLFVRLADAHSMKIIGSEVVLTELGSAAAVPTPLACQISLRDERSFITRLTQSGEWVLGFGRSSNPLGSALLAHVCVARTKADISASAYVAIVAVGGPPAPEGIRARWSATQVETDGTHLAFGVSCQAEGMAAVDVGQLSFKVAAPAK
jgi:hypothetical protein